MTDRDQADRELADRELTDRDQADRELAETGEILRVLAGSEAYGISLEAGGDRDELGICVEPKECVLGLRSFEQYVYRSAGGQNRSRPGDLDLTIYGLRKWARLAAAGNPTILLVLFSTGDLVLKGTPQGALLQDAAELFVTKAAGRKFLGYLNAQYEKLTGRRTGHTNRPELIETHGFDTKFAAHAVRLGLQGVELLTTGRITLPIAEPERSWLVELRGGRHTLAEAVERAEYYQARLLELTAPERRELPDSADLGRVNELLIGLYESWWQSGG
jgi:hypothetical protein